MTALKDLAARFRRTTARFGGDRGGNFAVVTGMIATTLALSVGFAVNTAQSYQVKSSLLAALDAAVTSTARDLTTGKISTDEARPLVEAFLAANSDPKFAVSKTFTLDTLTIDQAARTIRATAYANVDLAFPFFTTSDPKVSISSAAVYSDRSIEVAMVLDVTGSMKGQKIKDLKTAADNAVTTFLAGQDPKKPRVRVAIVPYSDAVNTGELANTVHVETKFTTGEPPRLNDPRSVSTAPDKCATERKGSQQFTDASPTKAMVNRDYRLSFCPTAALKPLSANLSALKTTITDFEASGLTAGHIGIQWGWYILSPKWNDVLKSGARPAPYKGKVAKYAIIMTDGEFNTAFAGVAKDGKTTGGQADLSRSNAEKLCGEMKKDGVEIFTIGFMLKESGAKAVMKNCATTDTSSAKHYFEAATGAQLDGAFQEIARNIERLALTE